MPSLGETVRRLRRERKLTQLQIAQALGQSAQAVQQKEVGRLAFSMTDRKKLATLFEMPLEEFDALWRADRVHKFDAPKGIPVINRAPAGTAHDYDHDQSACAEFHDAHEYIDRGGIDDPHAFAIVVVGDSMEPSLFEGDYVVFTPMSVPKPRAQVVDGVTVFVRFTPEAPKQGCLLARWKKEDTKLLLTKDNTRYPPLAIDREDIAQLSVAVERRTRRI